MRESPLRDLARQLRNVARQHPSYSQVADFMNHVDSHLSALAFAEEAHARETQPQENNHDFLDSDPRDLNYGSGYTTRLCNMFDNFRLWPNDQYTPLQTVRDVIVLSERDLLVQANIGKRSVQVLKGVLAQHGLRLGMELGETPRRYLR